MSSRDAERSAADAVDPNEVSTADEMRKLAQRAQAESAKAEALAKAAAGARARASRLRRQADNAPASDPGGQAERRPSPRRRKVSIMAAAVCAGLVLAFVGASVQMMRIHQGASHQRQLADEFAAAARRSVVTLTSLDATNPERSVQRILDDSTGTFRDEMTRNAGDFTKTVAESQLVERGTVQAAVVDLNTMTSDSAVVLVASTSEVVNADGAKQGPRKFRLVVTMTRDGERLKMAKVDPVL